MNKTTLVIMAAGMGSRYKGGIKQLETVGPNGESILHYSLFDAIEAGFNKVVFVIRKELREAFDSIIDESIRSKIEVEYAYQELSMVPSGYPYPEGRMKPWGTGHAVLVTKELVDTPFAVINADDFYGKNSFRILHDYLAKVDMNNKPMDFTMVGFSISNTLSDNGTVKRGHCTVDENGMLCGLNEMYDIERKNGVIVGRYETGDFLELDENSIVSMSMFGFVPGFFDVIEGYFKVFLDENKDDVNKVELNLPTVVDLAINNNLAKMKVLTTPDSWFGVTYSEDREKVVKSLKELHEKKVYPAKLFN
ncbi:MAG: nucleotidyltransferase [Lachnospiraceae bacterium]|nr:nucleotidyltransferase [Lachnospiraceae bacterium]